LHATSDTRTLPARAEALATLHEMQEQFWGATESLRGRVTPPHLRHGLATAVSEVAANIIRYAKAPAFEFALSLEGGKVEARFTDSGVPFTGVPDGDFNPDMLAEGGMGLALAKRALHALDYRRMPDDTNRWTLVVLLPAPA
jgi:anti-sigma regulatory factor (Ser/Thr protein kinase)